MPQKIGTKTILPDFSPSSTRNIEVTHILHNSGVVCQDSHYNEFLSSGIDPGIIALNFKSLDGDITHEYLLSEAIAKLGNGKQTPHSRQSICNIRSYKIFQDVQPHPSRWLVVH